MPGTYWHHVFQVAGDLKSFFDASIVRRIAEAVSGAWPAFDRAAFERAAKRGLGDLELTARGRHIANALRARLPDDFAETARILERSLGPELPEEGIDGSGLSPFLYLPHVFLVAEHGLDHLEESLSLQHALTRRFSAEFSIRAFIEKHPRETLAKLREWTRDPSAHVRRLVSEGTRPRLPWAPRLRAFQKDPSPVLALLDLLKDDSAEYVRRSVANNLNDIGKDHPDILVDVSRAWLRDASPARERLVRHALRWLVKGGHPGALEVLGFGKAPVVAVGKVTLRPRRVPVGGRLEFEVVLRSSSASGQRLAIDYAVEFPGARAVRRKVFKLTTLELDADETETLRASVGFAPLTTRRVVPGRHRLDLLVNGVAFPLGGFTVVARRRAPRR